MRGYCGEPGAVYGRHGGPRFKVGDSVVKTMGVRLRGTVSPRFFSAVEWTDGTYRWPDGNAESREAVPVEWTDGTRGWIHARFLALATAGE